MCLITLIIEYGLENGVIVTFGIDRKWKGLDHHPGSVPPTGGLDVVALYQLALLPKACVDFQRLAYVIMLLYTPPPMEVTSIIVTIQFSQMVYQFC